MITIRDILTLEKFSGFQLVAGSKGLDRPVIRGGFIDHESIDDLRKDNIRHEMILSNFPMIKDHPEKILDYVRTLIESDTACFALKTTLFKTIPKEAIELADQYDYPLFIFEDMFLDKLIVDIDRFVNDRQQLKLKLDLITKIQNVRLSVEEVRGCVCELNRYFYKHLQVCYLKNTPSNSLGFDYELARSLLGKSALVLPIDDQILIIYSDESDDFDEKILIQKLGLKEGNYYIGVSGVSGDYSQLRCLLKQAQITLKYAIYRKLFFKSYEALGIYQMLIPLLDQDDLPYYYDSMIQKIIDYDTVNKSDLLETAIAYVHADGNIKETAEALYQHTNTVRFRIRKLKEIIELDQYKGAKYETLALAIHLYEMGTKG